MTSLKLLKRILVCLIFLQFHLFFECAALTQVKITEVMYNPPGTDLYGEFFELCNLGNETLNLTDYSFKGVSINLSNIIIKRKACIIFANTKNQTGPDNDFFDLYNVSNSFCNCTFEFKGYLLNTNFTIVLCNSNGSVLDNFTYDDSLANGNGLSLNRCNDLIVESSPTPFYFDFESCSLNVSQNETNVTNINLFNETKSLTNQSAINQTHKLNITNETIINSSLTNSSKDLDNNTLVDETDANQLIIKIDSINQNFVSYRIYSNCSYTYWIEDLFKNIIKPKLNSNSSSKKQFTSKYDSAFFLKAKSLCANETAARLVYLNFSFEENINFNLDLLSKSKKIRLEVNADFVKFNSSILCVLNQNKNIFSFYSDSQKPLINSDLKFEIILPEQYLEDGNNKIDCEFSFGNNSKHFIKTFKYAKKSEQHLCSFNSQNSDKKEEIKVLSFYTLDQYLKSKNHFFVNLNANSFKERPLFLELYELKNETVLTENKLNKTKLDFYAALNKPNTTFLVLIRNNTTILSTKFLNVSLKVNNKSLPSKPQAIEKLNLSNDSYLFGFVNANLTDSNNKTPDFEVSKENTSQEKITSFFSLSENPDQRKIYEIYGFTFPSAIMILMTFVIALIFIIRFKKNKKS